MIFNQQPPAQGGGGNPTKQAIDIPANSATIRIPNITELPRVVVVDNKPNGGMLPWL